MEAEVGSGHRGAGGDERFNANRQQDPSLYRALHNVAIADRYPPRRATGWAHVVAGALDMNADDLRLLLAVARTGRMANAGAAVGLAIRQEVGASNGSKKHLG
jgi:hypothetical protein